MSITYVDCAGQGAGYAPIKVFRVSDETLIERISRRDEAALQILRRRHQGRVSSFIHRFLHDQSQIEDLVSDTFFAAWQQASHFESRSSVATWLLAIARYKALSARQRRSIPTEAMDDIVTASVADPTAGPDDEYEQKDAARYLRRCLAALPVEQAMLIELVYYRDKSVKEAALLAKIPENTVKSRMYLARKKLSAMLAAADLGNDPINLEKKSTNGECESQAAAWRTHS
jgi:RNA polymerase sigma-70 factor (ECF subfamily)